MRFGLVLAVAIAVAPHGALADDIDNWCMDSAKTVVRMKLGVTAYSARSLACESAIFRGRPCESHMKVVEVDARNGGTPTTYVLACTAPVGSLYVGPRAVYKGR